MALSMVNMNRSRVYLYFVMAVVLTAFISLSIHVVILQYFHPPVLSINPGFNQIVDFAIRFGTASASIFIYVSSKEYWISIKPLYRVILFALLIMALTEMLFRGLLMNIIVGNPWPSEILRSVPSYLKFFSLSLLICCLVPAITEKRQFRFLRYAVLALIMTVVLILIGKIAVAALAPLLAHVSSPAASNISQVPYGINILIPAYMTYLEPTIAAFIVFYLIKNRLSVSSTLAKGLILGGIIMAIHAGIYSILQIACSEGNIFYRIFYYGQFLWEYLALGLLTAYSNNN